MAERTQTDAVWDGSGQITSTGSANAYVLTISQPLSGYYQGMPQIRFKANFTCSGSSMVNLFTPNFPAGLGAVTLKKQGGASNLASGDILSGGVYTIAHDGTFFQVLELNATSNATTLGGLSLSSPGDRWGVIPFVHTDGVMEVGRYFDFHNSDASAVDNANRLETNGGTVGLYEAPGGGALKRLVSATNSTLAQGDLIYFDGTNFIRLAAGSADHVLTQAAGPAPVWAATKAITAAAVQASTSGTAIDFTGLPAAIRRITVLLDSVSLSGTDNLLIQIGDSGGIETTGYTSKSGNRATEASSTAGFIWYSPNAAQTHTGHMTITRITSNTWVASLTGAGSGNVEIVAGAGRKDLDAELTQVRITRTGANSFDSGQVAITYEF